MMFQYSHQDSVPAIISVFQAAGNTGKKETEQGYSLSFSDTSKIYTLHFIALDSFLADDGENRYWKAGRQFFF